MKLVPLGRILRINLWLFSTSGFVEEQNYNMIDNVLNNGAEKAQKEANKKAQEQPAVKVSLKARLAEKKAQVAGSGQEHEVQENTKKNQREV